MAILHILFTYAIQILSDVLTLGHVCDYVIPVILVMWCTLMHLHYYMNKGSIDLHVCRSRFSCVTVLSQQTSFTSY